MREKSITKRREQPIDPEIQRFLEMKKRLKEAGPYRIDDGFLIMRPVMETPLGLPKEFHGERLQSIACRVVGIDNDDKPKQQRSVTVVNSDRAYSDGNPNWTANLPETYFDQFTRGLRYELTQCLATVFHDIGTMTHVFEKTPSGLKAISKSPVAQFTVGVESFFREKGSEFWPLLSSLIEINQIHLDRFKEGGLLLKAIEEPDTLHEINEGKLRASLDILLKQLSQEKPVQQIGELILSPGHNLKYGNRLNASALALKYLLEVVKKEKLALH